MYSLKSRQHRIPYKLIRSNRRTVSIAVQPDGEVLVRAPLRLSELQITKFVEEKSDWIIKHQEKFLEMQRTKKALHYVDGEVFTYQGQDYTLKLHRRAEAKRAKVRLEGEQIILEGAYPQGADVRTDLKAWCVQQADDQFRRRAAYFAKEMGVTYSQIRIREQKTRWGSCSSLGNLNFNWKLILAPPQILDYVVVHELSHRKYMDHSKDFWKLVESILPDYTDSRKWLREYGDTLNIM